MTTPFSYHLYHIPTGKHYYGIKHSKDCHPNQLWTTYFSSSKIVKQFIVEYGENSFSWEVRRIFDTTTAALAWEHKVLRRLGAARSEWWINRHNGGTQFRSPQHQSDYCRRRASETHKGKPKSEEWKAKVRIKALEREKQRRLTGWKMPEEDVKRRAEDKRGKSRPPEMVKKMRVTKTGTHRLYLSCGAFVMV